MNSRQLRYLRAVALEKSISKAAAWLGISQPSLSQYIHKLETELNIELIDRSSNPIRLTDAGEIYLQTGSRILELEEQMLSRFNDLKDNRTGKLVVGASPYRSICMMPAVLKEFKRHFPGIQVVLDEKINTDLQDAAEKGELDMAITTLPIDESKFAYRSIMKEEIVLLMPAEHPLNAKLMKNATKDKNRLFPVVDMRLLADVDFITLWKGEPMHKIFDRICEKAGISPNKSIMCRNLEAAYAMVEAGLGAAAAPYSLIKYGHINSPATRFYSILQAEKRREMVVIYRKDQYLSNAARTLIDIMARQ